MLRSSSAKWPRFAPALLLLLGGGVSVAVVGTIGQGCSSRVAAGPVPIDCTEDQGYDSFILENYGANQQGWYAYGDNTAGATRSGLGDAGFVLPIEGDAGRCGSHAALYLATRGFNDWGSAFGTYAIGGYGGPSGQLPCTCADGAALCPVDGGAFEGLGFWARSMNPTGAPATKGFTVNIFDKNSYNGANGCGVVCTTVDGSMNTNGTVSYSSPSTAMGPSGGGATSAFYPAGICGLGFAHIMEVTDQWQFYFIPYSDFEQAAEPRRIATGFDPFTFFQIIIRAPKEAQLALWIDGLGFYRHKADAGAEAGH